MSFRPSDNLADQIARHLSKKIIHAEFKPGERIVEDKLARELGISRSPLREALRMLEKDGLVELAPRHGVRITTMDRDNVACIYDILTELYTLLVRKLFEKVTDETVKLVNEAIKKLENCAKAHDVEGYYDAIFDFGAVAMKCVNIPMLERMITDLWPSKRRVEFYITELRRNDLVQNASLFRQAYKKALKGDTEGAIQAVRTYTQGEKEYALKHIPADA